MSMSSCELTKKMLSGQAYDRIGYFDHGPWFDTLQRWVQEGYPTVRDEYGNDIPLDYSEHFGYDMYSVGGWFDIWPIVGCAEVLEETAEWKIVRNGAGAVLKNFTHQTSSPEYLGYAMTSREVWERDYRSYFLTVDRARVNVEQAKKQLAAQRTKGQWTFYGHQFVWENLRGSLGNVCMLESLLDEPEWIHDICRVYTDLYKAIFRILFEEAGIPDGIWIYEDLGYRNGLMCSPATLDTVIFPYYRELVEFFRQYDLPVILHSDGRIDEAIPLIIDAGFVAINPMEVKAGCDIFAYVERFGQQLAFIGGFDGRILETNDIETIRHGVTSLSDGMKARDARFMFGVDHSISVNVSYDSFRYALDVYHELMPL